MSRDPYETLGVKKDATPDDIKKAYRGLAAKLHPDLNPGDKAAEDRFKDVAVAYDLLGDEEKRARFDRGEIDAGGAETPRPRQRSYRDFAETEAGAYAYTNDGGFADFSDMSDPHDIFAEMFRRGGPGTRTRRGADVRYRLSLDFLDAVNGAKVPITLASGSPVDVTIPAGARDGQVLRLRGKGEASQAGAGDALIELEVRPHPAFVRKGDDIHLDLPMSLKEAVLGAKISVPTRSGSVTMTLPKNSNTGRVLRLKGKGVAAPGKTAGDQYVTLRVMLPDKPDSDLERFLSEWPGGDYDARG